MSDSDQSYERPGDAGDQQSAFNALVGHALMNAEFRNQLLNQETRAEAVKLATGREMTEDMDKAIESAIGAVKNLADEFDAEKIAAT